MADVAPEVRARLRELSLGPVAWGAWSWTFHDGSCWAAVGYRDQRVVGWAAMTREVDARPAVGCFVAESERGRRLGTSLVDLLLKELLERGVLKTGDELFASTWRWDRWPALLERRGLACVPWA
jgi:GNAT superfamily N-acetyltransferase